MTLNPYAAPLANGDNKGGQDDAGLSPQRTPSKGFLRLLIVANIGFGVAGEVVSWLTEALLPVPLRVFLEEQAAAEPVLEEMLLVLAIAVPLLALVLVSYVGLFVFWRPARLLYLIGFVLGLPLVPLFGPYVDAGWGAMLQTATCATSGVILALIYFSPLAKFYEKPKIAAS